MIKNKKVLVIEDDYSIREMLKDILIETGFDVVSATNGREGIKEIYQECPDVVLLDCMMPEMNGYEVVETIRKDQLFVNLPMIMLTANSSEADQVKGIQLGVDDYMTKPFSRQILIAKIKTMLNRKEISINANPLTQLPGNVLIYKEVHERLNGKIPFAFFYIDLANFKSYNDYYGFQKGDEIIKHTADILVSTVKKYGENNDFVGHIGGDDFVVISTSEKYREIAEKIIEQFDNSIKNFYSQKDYENSYIVTTDRQDNLQKFFIMTIAIACVSTLKTKIIHYGQLSEIAVQLKKYAKQFNKSAFMEEQRK
ncbi:MAG: response regulator [Elusimicrobiota bacterium]